MQRSIAISLALVAALCVVSISPALAADDGLRPIFDGKTLDGWSAPDMKYWSVEDGAITARSSAEVPCKKNQFLVWQLGELDDFELVMKFRIRGGKNANSGIQIRSSIGPDGHAAGYQADLDRAGFWLGALYDEHTGRRMLAKSGQKTVIDAAGKRTTTAIDASALKYDPDAWSEYRIVAQGSRIALSINGVQTVEVIDDETAHRDLTGKLALQIHSGPPMTVQFKDIRLKRLKITDGRKKVVMIAGPPSHASGQHEFNAGVKLLAKRLRAAGSLAVATSHNGWPKDPTAFDNADGIVFYADGQGRHPVMRHFEQVDALTKKGVGVMCMHYAVHVAPGKEGEYFKRWIGGFYETDYSSNPHWNADLKIGKDHPITRGVAPKVIYDEWYFSIRFRDGMKGVATILEAKPDDKSREMNNWPRKRYPHIAEAKGKSETLMWAVQRPDGGRGVGFTGGHWHYNWAVETQLKVVLNAITWVSGAEVPKGGVKAPVPDEAELNQNLDKKGKMARVKPPAK